MPRYAVILNVFAFETDQQCRILNAVDPFEAIISAFCNIAGIGDAEACRTLESDSFLVNVLVDGESGMEKVNQDAIPYPWQRISDQKRLVKELDGAVSVLSSLSVVDRVVAGGVVQAGAMQKLTDSRTEEVAELDKMQAEWDARKSASPSRVRQIDVSTDTRSRTTDTSITHAATAEDDIPF